MNNKNLEFLDILNIISFVIGVMNYDVSLTQGDLQELTNSIDEKTSVLLESINNHLREQDKKIDKILEVINNENNQEIS